MTLALKEKLCALQRIVTDTIDVSRDLNTIDGCEDADNERWMVTKLLKERAATAAASPEAAVSALHAHLAGCHQIATMTDICSFSAR